MGRAVLGVGAPAEGAARSAVRRGGGRQRCRFSSTSTATSRFVAAGSKAFSAQPPHRHRTMSAGGRSSCEPRLDTNRRSFTSSTSTAAKSSAQGAAPLEGVRVLDMTRVLAGVSSPLSSLCGFTPFRGKMRSQLNGHASKSESEEAASRGSSETSFGRGFEFEDHICLKMNKKQLLTLSCVLCHGTIALLYTDPGRFRVRFFFSVPILVQYTTRQPYRSESTKLTTPFSCSAEIIKIEHPTRGDDTRAWGPPFAEYKDEDGEFSV